MSSAEVGSTACGWRAAGGRQAAAGGAWAAPGGGECRGCLGPVQGGETVEVRELYEPVVGPRQVTDSIEGEEETYSLHGDQLDLLPLARDAVLLNLPQVPVCRDDCAGLCPE